MLYRAFKVHQPSLKVYGYFIYLSGEVIAIDLESDVDPVVPGLTDDHDALVHADETNVLHRLREGDISLKGDGKGKGTLYMRGSKLPARIVRHIGAPSCLPASSGTLGRTSSAVAAVASAKEHTPNGRVKTDNTYTSTKRIY